MAASVENPAIHPSSVPPSISSSSSSSESVIEKAKVLIAALNLISRNLPLPPDVFRAVSEIYNGQNEEEGKDSEYDGTLMKELEAAIQSFQLQNIPSSELKSLEERRFSSCIEHRLIELEALPSSRGEDMQMKCLLELYGLKLLELQKKIRTELSGDYWLTEKCRNPERQLYDWGMMRLPFPPTIFGIGDPTFVNEDDRQRRRRYNERMLRMEEEEKNQVEMNKRKFFAEILNIAREFQAREQASFKKRKQRNDGVLLWHSRSKQRVSQTEKKRLQLLQKDDQEAYMRMVEESKNERLKMLLGKTNDLLVRLGAAVQRQKDAEHVSKKPGSTDPSSQEKTDSLDDDDDDDEEEDEEEDDVTELNEEGEKSNAWLDGQRQYNATVHAIEEKVTEQPKSLQGGKLRDYQVEGLQWMLSLFNNNLNGILADEMGLGKTIQTIALIAYLIENKGVTGPHMIIAPKAVLPNWAQEFSTWAPSVTAVLYDGRPEQRKAIREEYFGDGKFSVLLTHYDLIMKDKKYLNKVHWFYLIVDEGHRLKNHECALARTLVTGYNIRRRLLLTGTPIQNSLQELWSLLNFLLPTIFNSVQNFEEWFNAPFACDVTLTAEEELLIINRLHQVLRPFLLRRKKDEVEKFLPGKTQVILKSDLSAWQKIYYRQVTNMGRVGLQAGIKSKSLQNLSMQLRKCCNHPYLFVNDYNMWQKEEIVRASGKFELLDRLLPKLERAGHRVLLFSQMTRLIDILEIYLQLHGFKYLRLDGSTKTEERGVLLKKFNAPDSPFFMFLLSTRAGGLGLNLQTADTVIIFDSDWNPQMDQQAEDRAHRIGQKKEVRVFVLVSVGSIEEEILDRAKQKMGIDAKVIQAGLFNTTSTAKERRAMLQEIMQKGTSSLGTDVPSEREINRLAARNEEEYWVFEQMDEERRQRERYRSRLMEDDDVPEWVFHEDNPESSLKLKPDPLSNLVLGKRQRKEVIYTDLLSDVQWMKAVEEGEDLSKINSVARARRTPSSAALASSDGERNSEGNNEENSEGAGGENWPFAWKTHKKKRSSHSYYATTPDGK
ncbi:putative ATP-dependent DNA helicase CHR719 isoform X1 [Carex rostrata]